jgi:rRNA-processing protein FCF1
MGIRIHEARKKYNLTSKQMNELLANLGYTGSTNNLAPLPDDILAKIEKHFTDKSAFTNLNNQSKIMDCSTQHENIIKKTFVLDTNVILSNLKTMFSFQEHNVVIPMCVIDELDRFKEYKDKCGLKARKFSKYLDELRRQGNLAEGVEISTGSILQVKNVTKNEIANKELNPNKPDDYILACALKLKEEGKNPILVSKDKNLCIKANALGIQVKD